MYGKIRLRFTLAGGLDYSMRRFSLRLRLYVGSVAVAAIAAFALCLWTWELRVSSVEDILLAIGFAVFIGLAYHYPLLMDRHLNVQVETAALFAALLLFKPPVAIVISMIGVACSLVVSRRIPLEIVFNTGQTGFYVALAGTAYQMIIASSAFPGPLNAVLAVVMAGVSGYLGNTLLVATVVGIQEGMSPLGIWLANWRYDILEHVALYLLGVLTALVVQHYFWALLLTAVPLAIVYVSLQRSFYLRLQTKDALAALADVVDERDPYTFAHSKRVAVFTDLLARAMKLTPQEVELITSAARVHDLGKVGVHEEVLNKPGSLNQDEWEKMRQHPLKGAQIVSSFPAYTEGRELIEHHHERIDGDGYPSGIAGEGLSIGARIIAVADALDAMTSDRVYRKALPLDVVRQEFENGAGTQWDKQAVEQLLKILPDGQITEDTPLPFVELYNRLTGDEQLPAYSA